MIKTLDKNRQQSVLAIIFLTSLFIPAIVLADWESLQAPDGGNIVKLHSDDNGTIYANTQSSGIFFSTDNANSWEYSGVDDGKYSVLSSSPSGRLYWIKIFNNEIYYTDDHFATVHNLNTPGIGTFDGIHAFSDSHILVSMRQNSNMHLYLTNDGGQSWEMVQNLGSDIFRPRFLEVANGIFVWFEYGEELYFSSDSGQNWTSVNYPNVGQNIHQLIATSANTIIATSYTEIYRSIDNGSSWTAVVDDSLQFFDKASVLDDGSLLVRSNFNITYRSVDDGLTWSALDDNLNSEEKSQVMISVDGRIVMGTEYGIYVSDDDGLNWESSSMGIREIIPSSLAILENGKVVAGFENLPGLHIYEDVSGWMSYPEYGSEVAVNDNGTLFSARQNGQMWISTDNGNNWSETTGFDHEMTFVHLFNSPGSSLFAWANSSSGAFLYRSDNSGESFTPLDAPALMDFTYGDDGILYIATEVNGVGFSLDLGETWIYPDEDLGIREVEASPDGNIYRMRLNAVQLSHNSGVDWNDIHETVVPDSIEFPGFNLNTMGVDAEGHIYMDMEWTSGWEVQAFDRGIYVSEDWGLSWEKISDSRANYFTRGLDGNFYAGTSRELIKRNDNVTSVENSSATISSFALEQNYPNPFNPATSISFTLVESGITELAVYNMLGRQLESLIKENLSSGTYTVTFNAEAYASGVYFYRLTQGSEAKVRRMMLVK